MKTLDKIMLGLVGLMFVGILTFTIGIAAQCRPIEGTGLSAIVAAFLGICLMFCIDAQKDLYKYKTK